MPEGGVLTLDIERVTLEPEQMPVVGALTTRAFAVFSVTDTGVGMDETTARHAFEPFFTTKPPSEGSGLGLATVFGIARQHGGFAEIDSRLGHGTTVRMFIPAVPLPPHLDTPHTPQPAVRGGTETIAVVEDSEPLRRLTRRVLETAGYSVHSLASGKEALETYRTLAPPPDLILSNVLLPGMNGVQLLHAMRDGGWSTPMLFTSGDPEHEGTTQPSLPPEIPVLAKPWTVDGLLREVRRALDDSRRLSS
jgi:CheY-like chemotaxis protein